MLKGKNGFYNRYVKRIIDIICALLAIMVFWWLYLIVAVLVRIKLGSPIIFKQERPGKIDKKTGKETIFNLYKFRTMTDKRDVEGNLLPDDVRLTKFGRILRSTSLDELPEAFNILKGDMSVIGPRPLLVEYLPYYTKEEHHRHDVRPGLSGWAQINGRNAIDSWEQRFQYDLEYVKNVSFTFDIKVVLKTIEKVLKRSDIQVGKQIKVGRLDTARGNKNENKDIPKKVEWIKNSENNKNLHYDIPLKIEKTEKWFENNKDRTDRFDAVIEADGVPCGTIGLLSIDQKNKKAEYYIAMGEISLKGKGVSTNASKLLLEYAFNVLKLNRVYLFTEKENLIAQ